MTEKRLIIIGGDAAGMSAATQAKRRRPELDVVVFERGPYTSFSACGVPYYICGVSTIESGVDIHRRLEKGEKNARLLSVAATSAWKWRKPWC